MFFSRLRKDIAAAKRNDPAARNKFEIWLTYSGVHALSWHRWANRLYRMHLKLLARRRATASAPAQAAAAGAHGGMMQPPMPSPEHLSRYADNSAGNASDAMQDAWGALRDGGTPQPQAPQQQPPSSPRQSQSQGSPLKRRCTKSQLTSLSKKAWM